MLKIYLEKKDKKKKKKKDRETVFEETKGMNSGWTTVTGLFNYTIITVSRQLQCYNNWATTWQNQQSPVWSESSLSAWRKLGSLATHWAHSEDPDQTGRMHWLIWVFAGRTAILLVLSCRCSVMKSLRISPQNEEAVVLN